MTAEIQNTQANNSLIADFAKTIHSKGAGAATSVIALGATYAATVSAHVLMSKPEPMLIAGIFAVGATVVAPFSGALVEEEWRNKIGNQSAKKIPTASAVILSAALAFGGVAGVNKVLSHVTAPQKARWAEQVKALVCPPCNSQR